MAPYLVMQSTCCHATLTGDCKNCPKCGKKIVFASDWEVVDVSKDRKNED